MLMAMSVILILVTILGVTYKSKAIGLYLLSVSRYLCQNTRRWDSTVLKDLSSRVTAP